MAVWVLATVSHADVLRAAFRSRLLAQ